ncbi:MAG: multicopper oxidase domain-containing protein, partial [Bacteroidetes bacterium]|nr:multicopper oxidase domain-containing protein [Bacteroidota bacterium]
MRKWLVILIIFATYGGEVLAQKNVDYLLIMRNTGKDTMWDGVSMKTYGFAQGLKENPKVPGVTLYANEGDTLRLTAWNISQGDPHTIHPHGLDVDQMNDGVPMTSFSIKHMKKYVYKIPCTNAGTYFYHCHMADVVHLQMGMYGFVVVRPKDGSKTTWTGGYKFDKEFNLLFSEFDKMWHDSLTDSVAMKKDSMMLENFNIPTYNPNYFLVNGRSHQQIKKDSTSFLKAKANETIYLRLGNMGYYLNEVIFPANLDATWVDSDGRQLPNAVKNNSLQIAPGERYGVLLKAKTEFIDSIKVRYINPNTYAAHDSEFIPVEIKGTVGIEDNSLVKPRLRISPNPVHDFVKLEGWGSGDFGEAKITILT